MCEGRKKEEKKELDSMDLIAVRKLRLKTNRMESNGANSGESSEKSLFLPL